jgi:hypothetical protein
MRTLKTKERLCCGTTDHGATAKLQTDPAGKKEAVRGAAAGASKAAHEGIRAIRPHRMFQDWSPLKIPTAVGGQCRQLREHLCPEI